MHHRITLGLPVAVLALTLGANPVHSAAVTPAVAVGAQYDTTHVYVAPSDVDGFVTSFLATFGGQSTNKWWPP